jgi:hypothetical protein
MTEDRGQRAEDRKQMTDVRGQRTEGRGQRAEGIVICYSLLVIRRSAEGRHLNSEFGLRISDLRERGLHCQNLT